MSKEIFTSQGITKFNCSELSYEECKKLVEIDYWDTLEALVKNTYLKLPPEIKKVTSRSTYKDNTKTAIWTLNCLFLGSIERYEELSDKSYETKLKLALLLELYIENRKILKQKGKKKIKKWSSLLSTKKGD